jgi:K+-transporting ATPase KdpF subunit
MPAFEENTMILQDAIMLLLSVLLFIYLIYALLRPEKF